MRALRAGWVRDESGWAEHTSTDPPHPRLLLLQLQLASRILLLAERCREFETAGERVVPVPMPDVAVGPAEGTVVAGPAASTRTAIGLLLSHPLQQQGQQQQTGGDGAEAAAAATGAGGSPALQPAPSSPALVAATVALTSGALVPVGLTAARHGLVPRADGLMGDAAALASAALRQHLGTDAGGVPRSSSSWNVVRPSSSSATAAPGAAAEGGVLTSEAPRASAGGSRAFPSDAALEASAAEQTLAAATASAALQPPAAAADGSRILAEVADSSEMDALDLFWRRYNRVLLDTLVLERQRAALAEENAGLQVRAGCVCLCVPSVTPHCAPSPPTHRAP